MPTNTDKQQLLMKKALVFAIFIVFACSVKAQYMVCNIDKFKNLPSATTYVLIDSLSETEQKYIEVLKTYWTLSKMEFITKEQLAEKYSPNNFFLSFYSLGFSTESAYSASQMVNGQTTQTPAFSSSAANFQGFSLWKYDDDYWKKDPKKREETAGKMILGMVLLYYDESGFVAESGLSGSGHVYNWSPGLLKNYLQYLTKSIKEEKEIKYYNASIEEKDKIKALKTDTLFVPEYAFKAKHSLFSKDKSPYSNAEEVFKKYPFKYKVLSNEELSSKILNSEKEFYYLNLSSRDLGIYISVVNSKTGEIIYLKQGTFKLEYYHLQEIAKLVGKK